MAATPIQRKVCTVDHTRIIVINTPCIDWFTHENVAQFAMESIVRSDKPKDAPKEQRDLMFPIPVFVIDAPAHIQHEDEDDVFDPIALLDDNKIRAHFEKSYAHRHDAPRDPDIIQTESFDEECCRWLRITARRSFERVATEYCRACSDSDLDHAMLGTIGFIMVSIDDYLPYCPDTRKIIIEFPEDICDTDIHLSLCSDESASDCAQSAITIIDRENAFLCRFRHAQYGHWVFASKYTVVDMCSYTCNVPYTYFDYFDYLRDKVFVEYYGSQ